mmetsp:Transcript_22434/g.56289  ORF Transcript_22434/g.56289 Transcript_22434/m.56289 type:complete len:203 (+) Transcript_22434:154-762(+)
MVLAVGGELGAREEQLPELGWVGGWLLVTLCIVLRRVGRENHAALWEVPLEVVCVHCDGLHHAAATQPDDCKVVARQNQVARVILQDDGRAVGLPRGFPAVAHVDTAPGAQHVHRLPKVSVCPVQRLATILHRCKINELVALGVQIRAYFSVHLHPCNASIGVHVQPDVSDATVAFDLKRVKTGGRVARFQGCAGDQLGPLV